MPSSFSVYSSTVMLVARSSLTWFSKLSLSILSTLFSSVRNCLLVSGRAMWRMGSPGETAGMVVIPMTMPLCGEVIVSNSFPSSPVFVASG